MSGGWPSREPSRRTPRGAPDDDVIIPCDHLELELARRGHEELQVFRELKPSIALGVGVVDIKDNEVERPDEIARRIEGAVKVLGPQRIRWVHPDCGFWMLPRSVADRKMRALVEGRDLALARSPR